MTARLPDYEGSGDPTDPAPSGSIRGPLGDPVGAPADDAARCGAAGPAQRRAADDEPSDEALLERIARGSDRAAFGLIFDRYGARIKGFMMRGGAAADVAEEAAQEALLAVWRRAETFDPARAHAAAWIFAIVRNKRIDLARRAQRREPEPEDPSVAQEPPAPAETLLAAEVRDARVRRALEGLGRDQHAVVILAFYEGCSHAEIAERLSLPLGTVKSRLRLAFGALRNALGCTFRDELLDF
ncbi:MAG: sigma-70 family RNA polymerase sigma factor [Pseudomonadota bacterium]